MHMTIVSNRRCERIGDIKFYVLNRDEVCTAETAVRCFQHHVEVSLWKNPLIGISRNENNGRASIIKHRGHIRHILSVESSEVKCGKAATAIEHPAHIRHILSIETTEI